MYDKITSLNKIVDMGLNVHKFYIPNNLDEFKTICNEFEFCTIRTDHRDRSEDLPFYLYDKSKDSKNRLNQIWDETQQGEYKLIIANAIQFDNIQEYNMVIKIQENGDFIFEASELKIPLRKMYEHPLLSCEGNIVDKPSRWKIYNNREALNKNTINNDLLTLYNFEIFNKWLEVTKYPIPVGIQNDKIVFWQII